MRAGAGGLGETLPRGQQGQGRRTSPARLLWKKKVEIFQSALLFMAQDQAVGSRRGLPRTAPQRAFLQTFCSPRMETSDQVK